jgi:CPA2 family monovalent cation:H+ antiporter-2
MAPPAPGDFKDVVLFLATAGIVVPLFRRWRISPVLGFLVAGVLLGPSGLGALGAHAPWVAELTINSPRELAQLGELGVVFLMFMIGLELSWARLWLMRRYVFGLGALQVLGCGLIVGLTAYLLGASPAASAAVGAAMALSSTAVVMPILTESRRQHVQAGRVTFAVLLFQDLAVAPILITLSLLGREDGAGLSPDLLLSFAPAVAAVAGLVGFGRFLLRPMMRSVAKARSEELFMAACLLVVIATALGSAAAGLSMALGAFLAGLLLAETEYRREVEATIEPFKGLLLGVFLVSVGMSVDIGKVLERPVEIVAAIIGLIALEVDLGASSLIGLTTLCVMFVAGAGMLWLTPMMLLGLGALVVAVIYNPERFARILAFMDPQKFRLDEGLQQWQAMVAFGAGGVSGVGLGNGRLKML